MSDPFSIALELQQLVSAEQAFHYRIVPVEAQQEQLVFKTDREQMAELQAELGIVLGKPVKLLKTTSEDLQRYLSTNYRATKTRAREELRYTSDFLEKVLLSARAIHSSDIHFEPYETQCRIRFRLDGKLIEQYTIPIGEYPVLINKIKIKAGLDIAEKRLPQDGRISVNNGPDDFDIRVSTLPTLHGEKIVLRLLSKETGKFQLSELGFTPKALKTYKEAIRKTHGILLISGPTGSGKTTTLYATLQLLNDAKTNILTIEDPIEYTLEGVNQVQLKENIGLDFASALRTFLRQDPDIIMVGEIRDVKTATMAIRAALTGHLVLATIHTNSAWGTVSRLIDMGVPPFLIANTLTVSVAQRLVRKLCTHCKVEKPVSKAIFPEHFTPPAALTTHFTATGCNQCYYTGYTGRKAIYEIIPVTKALTAPIKNNASEIDAYLRAQHINTLKDNAIELLKDGFTSVAEVYALLTD